MEHCYWGPSMVSFSRYGKKKKKKSQRWCSSGIKKNTVAKKLCYMYARLHVYILGIQKNATYGPQTTVCTSLILTNSLTE